MGQREMVCQPQFELLSWTFSLDVEWPNFVPYYHSDVELIEFSNSIGLVCHISADRSSISYDSIKVSGIFLLIGLGSWLCCKLVKFYQRAFSNDKNGPSSESQGNFGSTFKTYYFGPVDNNTDGDESNQTSVTQSPVSAPVFKRGNCKSEMKSSPLRRIYSTRSSPALNGKERFDCDTSSIRSILYETTSSDDISELSFDIDNSTFVRLDCLQQEIDQIKNSCLSMDEEFVNIKVSRNLPGLSNLMESGELNEVQQTEEQIQDARKCFRGLYSLTTINHSISLELTNYQVEDNKDDKITVTAEEENLPSLEWDELDDTSDRIGNNEMADDNIECLAKSSETIEDSWSCSKMSVDRLSNCYDSADWSSYSGSEMSSPENEIINISPKIDVCNYALSEWKGTSVNAETIRLGYREAASSLNLKYLQRIRGDNYCAIRATLFQVLSQGLPLPSAEQVYNILSQNSSKTLVKSWQFSQRFPNYANNINEGIRTCLFALDRLAAALAEVEDKSETLQTVLNSYPLLDLQLNEAVKLLMLERTISLCESMNNDEEVPLFTILMFARDTCTSVVDFMNNHLCKVGDTAGLEMVEMYLLGFTLNVSIRVIRPSAFGTDDYICFYPEMHKTTHPQVTLVAEDDRHYNILVE